MEFRILEEQFKKNLIENLNRYHFGWIDGDDEWKGKSGDNDKKADIIHREFKIAIEIKDDKKFSDLDMNNRNKEFKIKDLSRSLRADISEASKQLANYEGYKSLVIIRTDKADWPWTLLESAIFGEQDMEKKHDGLEWPSNMFNNTDESTKNVGGFLLWGRTRAYFIKNINPNVPSTRIISYKWIEGVFKNTEEIIPTKLSKSY